MAEESLSLSHPHSSAYPSVRPGFPDLEPTPGPVAVDPCGVHPLGRHLSHLVRFCPQHPEQHLAPGRHPANVAEQMREQRDQRGLHNAKAPGLSPMGFRYKQNGPGSDLREKNGIILTERRVRAPQRGEVWASVGEAAVSGPRMGGQRLLAGKRPLSLEVYC